MTRIAGTIMNTSITLMLKPIPTRTNVARSQSRYSARFFFKNAEKCHAMRCSTDVIMRAISLTPSVACSGASCSISDRYR